MTAFSLPFILSKQRYIKINIVWLSIKVNWVQEPCDKCFAIHISNFENLQTTSEKQNNSIKMLKAIHFVNSVCMIFSLWKQDPCAELFTQWMDFRSVGEKLKTKAQYFYSLKVSYEVLYKASLMFWFRTQCIQNKTFETPRTRPWTRLWITRNTGLFKRVWWSLLHFSCDLQDFKFQYVNRRTFAASFFLVYI